MIQRTLGKTGWKVGVIGFGAWGVGGQWGDVAEREALDAIGAAVDAGVNFFDTADGYGEPPGRSEYLIGQGLKSVRDKVIIATKVGHFARRHGHQLPYTHPLHIQLCCEASLYRMKTDYIDLYQCHLSDLGDPSIFLEAFEDLKRRGLVRAYGISTDDVEVLKRFNRDGTCATNQLDYSYLNRKPEEAMLPYCQEQNIGVIVRGPLAKGLCAGKFTRETKFEDSVRESWNGKHRDRFLQHLDVVEQVRFLDQPNRSMAQAALQYVISHPAVSVAIPGAKSPKQARDNAAAGERTLPEQELQQVRTATA